MIFIVLLTCAFLAGLLSWRVRRRLSWRSPWLAVPTAAILLSLVGGYGTWYHHRPVPPPEQRTLFHGVTYTREVRSEPRPLIIHVVTIDVTAPGVRLFVTPGDPSADRPLQARTTSAFLREYRVQVAINAGFFFPWHSNGPWDYYPHAGDPVSVQGLAISGGRAYAEAEPGCPTLFVAAENRAAIGTAFEGAEHAVSGREVIVAEGRVADDFGTLSDPFQPHPRTAVALDATGKRLLLVVIDGRQPNYSEGATLPELAAIVVAHGGATALNLDGGGSSTLVVERPDGRPQVLNSPIHGRHPPGRERPVANHLGVFASPE